MAHTKAERKAFYLGIAFGIAKNQPLVNIAALDAMQTLKDGWSIPDLDCAEWFQDLIDGGLTMSDAPTDPTKLN